MKRTKSKLDLNRLQAKFDELLDNLTIEDIISWKQHDMEQQANRLLDGETIEVNSNPVSYEPTLSKESDVFFCYSDQLRDYEQAA